MVILYNLSIQAYSWLIHLAAWFNPKAKLWVMGRKNQWRKLESMLGQNTAPVAWFHVSSLGEFEQGRPVMEAFKQKYPEYKIALSFFSPSGYEIRKNYQGADYIFYLPTDSRANARRLINLMRPSVAFFVKYEFWFHYLNGLHKRQIPTYIFSAIFRPQQLFFKPYGKWYRNMLKLFTHLYVQTPTSANLLSDINIKNVTVSGDTRFDRVYAITQQAPNLPLIAQFAQNHIVIVAGSTWEKDEELLVSYIEKSGEEVKLIIAPHETTPKNIQRLSKQLNVKTLLYSEANSQNIVQAKVLIIDSIGLLSGIYRYGRFAYIGGGFGKGIHNTLEAATFGLPVVFGPNYKRFQEACDLIDKQAAFTIDDQTQFNQIADRLVTNLSFCENCGQNAALYVEEMRGGTQKIIENLTL